ncbi:DUF4236 domain-containing protein [Nocardia abscessus]|uniref:DUF4236 domain-containing protein n=1 Tax=Nocardia abscessus TaxID=120957 RepID=UPI003CC7E9C0
MVQFRKSMKLGPVRITASKKGLGVSAGAGPVRGVSGRTARSGARFVCPARASTTPRSSGEPTRRRARRAR